MPDEGLVLLLNTGEFAAAFSGFAALGAAVPSASDLASLEEVVFVLGVSSDPVPDKAFDGCGVTALLAGISGQVSMWRAQPSIERPTLSAGQRGGRYDMAQA